MKFSVQKIITEAVGKAVQTALGGDVEFNQGWVRPCNDPKFGDYQFNGSLGLAKAQKANPRALAEKIVAALELDGICQQPEIAGPGFINLRLTDEFIGRCLQEIPAVDTAAKFDRLGIEPTAEPEKVAVDMSSPNLAKEMHVGHLRSTVIGESVSRILEFAGHEVERVNHVGDWGTQFGMLLAHLRSTQPKALADIDNLQIGDLEQFYVEAKKHFDEDEEFATLARNTVVDLQGGDPETLKIWKGFCKESLRHCHAIYDALGITEIVDRGESFYNDYLPEIVQELTEKGMVEKSEGADCIFLDGFVSRDGTPLPMMIRKSDGGFNYSTTDLAAARYRIKEYGAHRLVYVVGAPQKHHFNMLFAVIRRSGWADESLKLEHLAFGSMLGADGKPFKTREGGTVKLKDLLAEAVTKARLIIEKAEAEKEQQLSSEQIEEISQTVGSICCKIL